MVALQQRQAGLELNSVERSIAEALARALVREVRAETIAIPASLIERWRKQVA